MKKIVFFFLMTILIASCHQEELSSVPDEPEGKQPVFDLSEEEVLQGCIYVKLKEEPAGEVRVRSIGNTVTTGVKVLDRAASSLKIERMERTFPYAGKFEERTRKEGLHLWYNVVSIRPRACFFPLFSFLPLWLHYNLNPLCVQY